MDVLPAGRRRAALVLALLCFLAYLPTLDNGFISDDYVFLGRLDAWSHDWLYLFHNPPEGFRTTTYLALALLETLFGYRPAAFYAFTIALHAAATLLVWKLVETLTGSEETAGTAAALFAVFQAPQEAVMWLSGMPDLLAGLSVLGCLHLWARGRRAAATGVLVVGLLSKESAAIALLLIVLFDFWNQPPPRHWRRYSALALVSGLFAAVFVASAPSNAMIHHGLYRLSFRAVPVWLASLHRLAFPWLYLGLGALALGRRRIGPQVGAALAVMGLALLPYVFLTYDRHVPSRNTYMASMALAAALAFILRELRPTSVARAAVVLFIVANVGYLWVVKDRQFEERERPTRELVAELRARPPGPLVVLDFPMNPWIGKMTAPLVPGWEPALIHVNEPPESCPGCARLRWDAAARRYHPF